MAQIKLAEKAYADLDRLFEFLAAEDPEIARASMRAILEAIAVLQGHPLIGRPVGGDLRELVISRGKTWFGFSRSGINARPGMQSKATIASFFGVSRWL